ncbi:MULTISPECIES: DUF2326 domain-containing protein [Enterobacteriaceae]|uniref:DUF2326 domain-containing protein n=2 Tax=Enterobacterales TaxID=91347 RepID=UPI00128532B6|nr:DUF2326 domain-containing protein [Enterobacter roggenkampii]ECI2792831.1 hypothetical protein [Salmonella enterica subsp. enterica serovar Give]EGZ3892480.1 hypothetical protein [Salmonella enterica subsp. enterica serovar Bonn]EIY5093672.1 hypothetical protein [Klebsiella quasipneumoniae]ELY7233750.1 hypothetical protein [Klebsiella variicola]HAV9730006.1 hypothetical protein [Escherichia coli]HBS6167815.1 hypothetical protein [Klebsiella pneumoniae]
MLKNIYCEKLIRKELIFKNGLNAILGPKNGANSIGKSSVLMLIDYVFGGDDFITLCKDVISQVGHLNIEFTFEFDGKSYHFIRNTETNNSVFFRNNEEKLEWSIEDFRIFLAQKYGFSSNDPSLRNLVSRFTRIWGKDNYNPNKPLLRYTGEGYASIKEFLIKSFGYYNLIEEIEKKKSENEVNRKNIDIAFKQGFVKKVNLKEYRQAKQDLNVIDNKIDTIKKDLDLFAANIKAILDEKSLSLAIEKDKYLKQKYSLESKLFRIEENISDTKPIPKRYFSKVVDFFPTVNIDKLNEVEGFHLSISKILSDELKKEKERLIFQLNEIDAEISIIDLKIKEIAASVGRPDEIIDEVLSLSIKKKEVEDTVNYRERQDALKQASSTIKVELKEKTEEILSKISKLLNENLKLYNTKFYGSDRIPPQIIFSDTNYIFEHHSDSGTGKSYANMLALDVSFLHTTKLPIAIEDSIVFKNVEVAAIEKIVNTLNTIDKQVFISLDQLNIYSEKTRSTLRKASFMRISRKYPAFKVSWNIQSNNK